MKIKIDNLSFGFKDVKVFENLNFTIKPNEVTAILGVSGCGKSTLIKLLAGIYLPNKGQISYGIEGKSKPESKDKAVIFQDSTLFPWKNVRENIDLAKGENSAEVDKIAIEVGLFEALDYYPDQLSGGMKQRAEFGRVLAKSPKILLMDEPFSRLDVQYREHLQGIFLRIQATTKATTIFVTHNIREAMKVASYIKVLVGSPVYKVVEYETKNYDLTELMNEVEIILKKDFETIISKEYGRKER